jgi:hypothetical protein
MSVLIIHTFSSASTFMLSSQGWGGSSGDWEGVAQFPLTFAMNCLLMRLSVAVGIKKWLWVDRTVGVGFVRV